MRRTLAVIIGAATLVVGAIVGLHPAEVAGTPVRAMPVCSLYEQDLAQISASHGLVLHLACINPTDGAN